MCNSCPWRAARSKGVRMKKRQLSLTGNSWEVKVVCLSLKLSVSVKTSQFFVQFTQLEEKPANTFRFPL